MSVGRSLLLVGFCLTALGGHVSAQRGRGNMTIERPATPTRFDSQELGIAFDAPEGVQIYTPAAPGRYKSVLGEGRFVYLANSGMRSVSVIAKSSPNATEAELKNYKEILDSNPPQSKLEGFKMHHVRYITIGKRAEKQALEFVYDTQSVTIRQVVFIHNGKGITFTCSSLQAEYGAAEVEMFRPLFSRLEFR